MLISIVNPARGAGKNFRRLEWRSHIVGSRLRLHRDRRDDALKEGALRSAACLHLIKPQSRVLWFPIYLLHCSR
jgi:hypothetical protein